MMKLFTKIALFGMASFVLCSCKPHPPTIDTLNQKIEQRDDSVIAHRDQKIKEEISTSPAIIDGDAIMLNKSQLTYVKMARYHPTFSLEGAIEPIKQTAVKLPDDTQPQQILVKDGDLVKQGQSIALLKSHNKDAFISLTAPHAGMIGNINPQANTNQSTPLLTITDISQYQFVSQLPSYFKPHIHIGDTVELTVEGQMFGGQVISVTADENNLHDLNVQVSILTTQNDSQSFKIGQFAKGMIQYGQIEVGALLPDFAIIGNDLQPLDLNALYAPPYKPQIPIAAHAWVVKQNAHLHLADIHVIEYQPDTRRFLVSGITDDSLIVLTTLPKNADDKQVIID
ncbi:efflux RND transporter periplasmic adaptor subunit [Moraxella oculi]|uniref:RND efflux pump membrane fusion protein barrel-sandwich domain-containing protein n=1 Tax=Moraxella oculi TaxID=2940516 RepID=A0ABW8U6M6_9GAMM